MTKLWQMPVAYISALGIGVGQSDTQYVRIVAACFAVTGILLILAMDGSLEGAHRGVDEINRIERELGLQATAKRRPWRHALPYFLIVVVGIASCMIVYNL